MHAGHLLFAGTRAGVRRPAVCSRRTLLAVAVGTALASLLAAGPLQAQPVQLREVPMLLLPEQPADDEALPVFGSARQMHSSNGDLGPQLTFEGDARLRKIGSALRADRIDYWRDLHRVEATGNVSVEQAGARMTGPRLLMQLDTGKGSPLSPTMCSVLRPRP